MGKPLQLRLLSDALTGEWREGEAGEGQGSEPREPTRTPNARQEMCQEGPPTSTRWRGYHQAQSGAPAGLKGV